MCVNAIWQHFPAFPLYFSTFAMFDILCDVNAIPAKYQITLLNNASTWPSHYPTDPSHDPRGWDRCRCRNALWRVTYDVGRVKFHSILFSEKFISTCSRNCAWTL